ncbi:MAG: pyridoxamine 5'-phosphate oxidase [bacterium]
MSKDSEIHQLRRDYRRETLDVSCFDADPVVQFRAWFEEARSAGIVEPNAMTLGTADASGQVSCRTVLLKGIDAQGFVFFTNYASRKARQIQENPQASLLFPWISLERQIEVAGRVEKISESESLEYFLSRPFGSRIGAWVSEQSSVIPSREVLVSRFEELKKRFADGNVPKPEGWGGFRVVPDWIEFWQGGPDRLHDRLLYSRLDAGWKISRLSP